MTAAQIAAKKSAGAAIKVRRMDFEFPDDIPEFWYANDPYRTLLLTALSGTFPQGERFFVEAVRQFQDQVTDPELKKAIRAFIGQEAHHSKEHAVLNAMMERKGYPMTKIDEFGQRGLSYLRKRLSPQRQLAMTCALEHFTAILADQLLANRAEFIDKMDPRVAKIWAWHAVEETEHKAVAFDVYTAVYGRGFLPTFVRMMTMVITTIMFSLFTTLFQLRFLWRDGELLNLRAMFGFIGFLWWKPGPLRRMIPEYLDYYRPSFHPWDHDNRALITERVIGLADREMRTA